MVTAASGRAEPIRGALKVRLGRDEGADKRSPGTVERTPRRPPGK